MHRIIKWLALLGGFVVAVAIAFALYSHFLMDYSLENLEFALSATQKTEENESLVETKIYQKLVQDLAMDEVTKEDSDFKNLAVLEMVARSFNETADRSGNERAEIYLTQAVKEKHDQRSFWLEGLDYFFRKVRIVYQNAIQLIRYIQNKISPSDNEKIDVSSYLLLSQAEDNEKQWKLDAAADLYRKFLKFHPEHPDANFVTLAMAQVLMKQKKYREAQRILRELTINFKGVEEFQIASVLLQKINLYKEKDLQIEKLERRISSMEKGKEADRLKFTLGLQYLHSYSLEPAQKVFREIESSEEKHIRLRAKFYLGWIYKMQNDFDQGAEVMLNLLEDENLELALDLGSKAQLADIYYLSNDKEATLKYYQEIADQATASKDASNDIWNALADVEQAMIYFYDYGDAGTAGALMDSVEDLDLSTGLESFDNIRNTMQKEPLDPRDLAFKYLFSGKIYKALDQFKKKMAIDPDDAWTHSGIGTTYLLMRDFYLAETHAKKGYAIFPDTYTSAVYAHTISYRNRKQQASHLYENSLAMGSKNYIPSEYNLAQLMLLRGDYQEANDILKPLELLTRVGEETPLRPRILNNLAYSYWFLDKKDEALTFFYEAKEIAPNFVDATENISLILKGKQK